MHLDYVIVNPNIISTDVDSEKTIKVIYGPSNWPDKTGNWIVDEEYVKVIYDDGAVLAFQAIKAGNTTITFIPDDADDKTSLMNTCNVYISNKPPQE